MICSHIPAWSPGTLGTWSSRARVPHLFNETRKIFLSVCLKIRNLCFLVISIQTVFSWEKKRRDILCSPHVWMLSVSSARSLHSDTSNL